MGKKKYNQPANLILSIGRPVFNLLFSLVSLLDPIFLLLEKLPSLRLPKINLVSPLPSLRGVYSRRGNLTPLHFVSRLVAGLYKFTPPKRYLFFLLSIGVLSFVLYFEIFRDLPDPQQLSQYPSKLTTQILDRNGVLLYKIYKDENRTLVSLHDLPQHVRNAFLAAEDKDFYSHNGFSLPGLFRAFYKNLFDNKLEGGSTITQQLIKNTILTPEKTLTRKVKEVILAIKTEYLFTKDKIFEMYLNQVGFGGPAYGIQEAARQYFNLDAQDLDLSQAAFLAGLTRAPSKYSPFGDQPELATSRQHWVLQQMLKENIISEYDYNLALVQKLDFQSAKIEIRAPHFVMLVKAQLVAQLGESVVTQGGLKVYTTLDSSLQDEAQKIVTDEVSKLKRLNVTNGSALVTNPQTGEILAMIGSTDYFNLNQNGQVNLTVALRQPGSSIKPLNYALYFEKGHSPGNTIEDHPLSLRLSAGENWIPKNYDGRFHGLITLRQALASSYNIPSVLVLLQNGVTNFANFAQKLGITSWDDPARYGPSIALGSLEVKMTDLATAYSAFANQGITTPLHAITKVEKSNGENLPISSFINQENNPSNNTIVNAEDNPFTPKQNISPTTAYFISDILSDNLARTPAFGANSILNLKSAKVAVKTGTSNDLKDNWTIGYTPHFLVATWVGNNDSSPMSKVASGITGASPIWAKIFTKILEEYPEPQTFSPPENLVKVPVCILTGTLTCSGCPTRVDYFVKGTEPTTACDPADIERRLHPSPSPAISPTPL